MVIYACPQCGSKRIGQGALHVGALTGSKQVCRNCGYQGIPLLFDKDEAYQQFLLQLSGKPIESNEQILSEKDKMVLEYAKETTYEKEEKDIDMKPYGLFLVMGVTIIYLILFSSFIIFTSFVLFMNSSLQTFFYYYNISLLIGSIISVFVIPYGYIKRKKWAFSLSGFIFIYPVLGNPIGLIFLYYLTRPHVKAYFNIE